MLTQPTEMRPNNPRLTLNYGVMLVVAVIVVGLYLLALPLRLAELQTVCPHPTPGQCGLQATAERASRLQASGLSLEFYGAYYVSTRFIAALFWWAVGLLILLRRPSERIALLTAYLLLLYPTNNAGTLSALPQAYPWLELPVSVIGTAGWLCWIVFFFVFPNGRWVPRWRYIGWYIIFVSILFFFGPFFQEFAASPAGEAIATIFFPLTFLLCLGAQVYRYRKVAQLGERQQTKMDSVWNKPVSGRLNHPRFVRHPVRAGVNPGSHQLANAVVYGFTAKRGGLSDATCDHRHLHSALSAVRY
jgi:hypothetical protein